MSIEAISTNCATKSVEFEQEARGNILKIKIPKARGFEYLKLNEEIARLAIERELKFLDYRYIEGYEAIWSQEHDVVECEVELPQRGFPFERMFRNNEDVSENGKVYIETHIPDVKVELSEVTDEFHLLDEYKDTNRPRPIITVDRFDRRKGWFTSLKVTGMGVTNHDKAKEVIETIFASICFQFDCKTNLPLMLAVERNYSRVKTNRAATENFELTAVNQKYDSEALSLYWYAQSALGMPLLQYLALYQVIEFYYPIYSELAAQKKVANALKDPCFNSHNEKDIARIFNIVKTASSARSELSQLESTFKECIDASLLRDWLKSESEREEYFRSKNAVKLSEYKINSNSEDDELLRQVWQRFYNIRCRIVHTKGAEGELEVLHPQSKEVKFLEYDIQLANFLAHRVLISSSKPINVA
ncbi:hypothetical protein [Thalassolituus alkanivorans]|uniref:hypothetical protein n=1 Tax=Thalassolituus alkanivorans TaxID=2881055 RepID=UPI001E4E4DEF|nr:hypothetical protein [Thalassolituus alkanivorans]MCB2387044.1 hypothetical protein [Thalassolituus alkanivorans]MCB2421602.1 hypothetical protein [Thalassolituus alkanivorans]